MHDILLDPTPSLLKNQRTHDFLVKLEGNPYSESFCSKGGKLCSSLMPYGFCSNNEKEKEKPFKRNA